MSGKQGALRRWLAAWAGTRGRLRPPAHCLLLTAYFLACHREPSLVRLEIRPADSETRLTLLAAPGARINARLKPALELRDGTILRFDSPHLTPDSSYFSDPPIAVITSRTLRIHGTLRASVCAEAEKVCRTVEQEI
ncbi:MAG: hypothetical protein ACREMO_09175 [Gemmatimonadales bacterium]